MLKASYKLNDPPITLKEFRRGLEKLMPAHEEYIRISEANRDQILVDWIEAYQKVKDQDPYYIEIPNTVERVTPAAVEGQSVEQQTEEENVQLPKPVQE